MRKEVLYLTIFSTVLFFLSAFLGYYHTVIDPSAGEEVIKKISEDLFFISDVEGFNLFLYIFLRNIFVTFTIMLLGVLLGLIPLIFIFINGYILGVVSYFVIQSQGWKTLLLGVLPHGVIEVPIAMSVAAYGLFLGWSLVFRRKLYLKEAVFFYIKLALPFLFLAALIESYITSLLI